MNTILQVDMYSDYNPKDYYYITSIDVGVRHLGISFSEVNHDFTLRQVIWFDCIDITSFVHLNDESKKSCSLYHAKTFCDYLEHVFYLHSELFDASFQILIERQPPQGYVVVEQLIFYRFREKVTLISPNSVHAFFNWGRTVDYEKRKYYSEQVAELQLRDKPRAYLLQDFRCHPRKHDISDSICIVLYWCAKKNRTWLIQEEKKRCCHVDATSLEQFIFYG